MKLTDLRITEVPDRTAIEFLALRCGRADWVRSGSIEKRWGDPVVEDDVSGCWVWTGATTAPRRGYAKMRVLHSSGVATIVVHRLTYALAIDEDIDLKPSVAPSVVLDHDLGCPRSCVNPHHVRPASWRANVARGRNSALTSGQASRYVGAHWSARYRVWQANIKVRGRGVFLWQCRTDEECAAAYDAACLSLGDEPINHQLYGVPLPTPEQVERARSQIVKQTIEVAAA